MKKATTIRWLAAGCCLLLSCACLMAGETNRDEAAPGLPSDPALKEKARKPAAEFPFKPFYLDVSVGYGFDLAASGLARETNGFYNRNIDGLGDSRPFYFYDAPCSLGEGLRVGLSFGYRFNRYLALEIGGMYVAYQNTDNLGAWSKPTRRDTTTQNGQGVVHTYSVGTINDVRSVDAQTGQLSLQLVAGLGFSRWDPYVKAGIGLAMANVQGAQRLSIYQNDPDLPFYETEPVYEEQYELPRQMVFRVGFVGAIGLNCHLSSRISLFAEWQFSVYNLHTLSWNQALQEAASGNAAAAEALNAPAQRFVYRDRMGFGSHGLNLGLKIKF